MDSNSPTFIGLAIRCSERDYFYDKSGKQKVSREANRHYHCESRCLINRHPYFNSALIRMDPELQLNAVQLAHFQHSLHVQFQGQLQFDNSILLVITPSPFSTGISEISHYLSAKRSIPHPLQGHKTLPWCQFY